MCGQPVEVLDISGGELWLVKTTDPATGRTAEGLVRASWLTTKPPPSNTGPIQNGTEPLQQNGDIGIGEYVGMDANRVHLRGHPPPTLSAPASVLPGALFGTYEPPKSMVFGKPEVEMPIEEESVMKITPTTEPALPTNSVQAPPLPPKGVSGGDKELEKLQDMSVSFHVQLDTFDPVEVYVAIADFTAAEETSISLSAGQHVQVSGGQCVTWRKIILYFV